MSYTLIHNGRLIDGTGSPAIADGAVLIHNNQIQAAGAKADLTVPDAAVTMIDAQGGTILPGFIDCLLYTSPSPRDPE